MAKQTFTTGQVLTAAQMTSLQQTAMGGGAATAKTASYVLVAADAGTTVAMNAAGATTITVNTGLFAAGDTVFIQNLGAGACTVTAGTATVATAGSLILPQNDAGILYFTATGTAIFYDYIQAGAVSPLTTKGDVYTFSTSDARLGVGANDTVLTADSAQATGLKWATAASGGMTLIASGSLSGSTTTVSSIPATYEDLVIYVRNFTASATTSPFDFYVNGNANGYGTYQDDGSTALEQQQGGRHKVCKNINSTNYNAHAAITVFDYTNASVPLVQSLAYVKKSNTTDTGSFSQSSFPSITAAVSSIGFVAGANTWTAGTYEVWGRK